MWWQRYPVLFPLMIIGWAVLLLILWSSGLLKSQWAEATTAYFVLANLIVLWWYADTTHRQMELAGKDYIERNKPVVVTDKWEHPEREDNFYYVVRNVGGGFALNVYYVIEGEPPIALGGIGPGTERRFPSKLNDRLCDRWTSGLGEKHLLIAEGPYTRTTQWTATLNFRTPMSDARSGHVLHGFGRPHTEPLRGVDQPLDDFIEHNGTTLFQQLEKLK